MIDINYYKTMHCLNIDGEITVVKDILQAIY